MLSAAMRLYSMCSEASLIVQKSFECSEHLRFPQALLCCSPLTLPTVNFLLIFVEARCPIRSDFQIVQKRWWKGALMRASTDLLISIVCWLSTLGLIAAIIADAFR